MVTHVENDIDGSRRTLCDWVKNFRIKKIQMKRKLRGAGSGLRVCAILSTALMSAEHELRRKQQERFNRWLEMQSKIDDETFENCTQTEEHDNSDAKALLTHRSAEKVAAAAAAAAAEAEEKMNKQRRDEITNLWKYELSGLDQFMRNMSNNNNQHRHHHHHHQCNAQTVAS